MARFRKKPLAVEAVQWFPGAKVDGVFRDPLGKYCISTLEGVLLVSPGDWIITGVAGEKYPCKPEIFGATYEPIAETQEAIVGAELFTALAVVSEYVRERDNTRKCVCADERTIQYGDPDDNHASGCPWVPLRRLANEAR